MLIDISPLLAFLLFFSHFYFYQVIHVIIFFNILYGILYCKLLLLLCSTEFQRTLAKGLKLNHTKII